MDGIGMLGYHEYVPITFLGLNLLCYTGKSTTLKAYPNHIEVWISGSLVWCY